VWWTLHQMRHNCELKVWSFKTAKIVVVKLNVLCTNNMIFTVILYDFSFHFLLPFNYMMVETCLTLCILHVITLYTLCKYCSVWVTVYNILYVHGIIHRVCETMRIKPVQVLCTQNTHTRWYLQILYFRKVVVLGVMAYPQWGRWVESLTKAPIKCGLGSACS